MHVQLKRDTVFYHAPRDQLYNLYKAVPLASETLEMYAHRNNFARRKIGPSLFLRTFPLIPITSKRMHEIKNTV